MSGPFSLDEMTPLLYRELREAAGRLMRGERQDHTLQPTALVNEAYLRLASIRKVPLEKRCQVLALFANKMRQVLVDHARKRSADKRGSGQPILELKEQIVRDSGRTFDVLEVDEAMDRLTAQNRRMGKIAELRLFGGLTHEEIGESLQISAILSKKEWQAARTILGFYLSS